MRKLQVFLALLALALLPLRSARAQMNGAGSYATGAAPVAPASMPGAGQAMVNPLEHPELFQECGLSCDYNSANQNLSLMAVQMVQEKVAVEDAHKDYTAKYAIYSSDKKNKDAKADMETAKGHVIQLLVNYCSSGDPDECWENYKTVYGLRMQKVKAALEKNDIAAGDLKDTTNGEVIHIDSGKAPVAKAANLFYAPTTVETDKQIGLQKLATIDQSERSWIKVSDLEPKREDFPDFEEKDRYKGSGSLEKIKVRKYGADGKPAFRDKDYQDALKLFKDKKIGDKDRKDRFEQAALIVQANPVTSGILPTDKRLIGKLDNNPLLSKAAARLKYQRDAAKDSRDIMVNGVNDWTSKEGFAGKRGLANIDKKRGKNNIGSVDPKGQLKNAEPQVKSLGPTTSEDTYYIRVSKDDLDKQIHEALDP